MEKLVKSWLTLLLLSILCVLAGVAVGSTTVVMAAWLGLGFCIVTVILGAIVYVWTED